MTEVLSEQSAVLMKLAPAPPPPPLFQSMGETLELVPA